MTDPAPATRPRRSPLRWLPVVLLILALPVLIFAGMRFVFRRLVPPVDTAGVRQLRVVGQAVRRFAQEHNGVYPPSLAAMVDAGTLPADARDCPPTADGTRVPYVYPAFAAAGLREQTVTNGTVLAYEPLAAGDAGGSAVLYADGSVTWISADALTDELDHGKPPPQQQEP